MHSPQEYRLFQCHETSRCFFQIWFPWLIIVGLEKNKSSIQPYKLGINISRQNISKESWSEWGKAKLNTSCGRVSYYVRHLWHLKLNLFILKGSWLYVSSFKHLTFNIDSNVQANIVISWPVKETLVHALTFFYFLCLVKHRQKTNGYDQLIQND